MDVSPDFDAYIGADDVTVTDRDVALLRAIDETGSMNVAADNLDRSYAHAQRRIVELEGAFGSLVTRHRGGADGGGSELTDRARELLTTFARVQAEFAGVAEITETVIEGSIVERQGELVTVDTEAGQIRALVPEGDGTVEIALRADTLTLTDPSNAPVPEGTSARNRFQGTVIDVERGERIVRATVDIGAERPVTALVTESSRKTLNLAEGRDVIVSFKATATRGVPV